MTYFFTSVFVEYLQHLPEDRTNMVPTDILEAKSGRFKIIPKKKKHHRAKLTEGAVREIRRRHSAGESMRSLSAEFDVSPPAIGQIVQRATWKWVKP